MLTSLQKLHDNPQWNDLRNHHFVLLGASAEMAPLENLLRRGANIIAVDLPRADWKHLIAIAEASPGSLRAPARSDLPNAPLGANLLTDLPELAHWLLEVPRWLFASFFSSFSCKKNLIGVRWEAGHIVRSWLHRWSPTHQFGPGDGSFDAAPTQHAGP